jgi:hypothetical protein
MCVHCESLTNKADDFRPCEDYSYYQVTCPAYHSTTYFAVVVGTAIYKGWRVSKVGWNKMKFVNTEIHDDYTGTDAVVFCGGYGTTWMEECWNKFLAYLEWEQPQ